MIEHCTNIKHETKIEQLNNENNMWSNIKLRTSNIEYQLLSIEYLI